MSDELISRESLLKGIAELKESPWYNLGKHDPKVIRHEYMEAMMHYGYLQRKETVEIIEDLCIKKEPAVTIGSDLTDDSGWISVKYKLPEECENVLIYCPEFVEEIKKALYTEGEFYAEREDLIVRPAPNGYCTHWRPFPKPPKGE